MKISLLQAAILGCYVALFHTNIFYTVNHFLRQPLVAGFVTGLVLGDVPAAMMASAPIQLLYMGVLVPGGSTPTDTCIGSVIGVATALVTGVSPEQAVVIAVPAGLIGNLLLSALYIIHGTWAHKAEAAIDEGNFDAIPKYAMVYPFITSFILYAPVMTITLYLGLGAIDSLLAMIPANVIHALEVVGAVLPALGFALIITVIGKKRLLPYFVAAFFIAVAMKALGGINVTIYAIVGAVIGYLHVVYTSTEQEV